MKRILSVLLLCAAPVAWGQTAAEIASRQEALENYQTLKAQIEDMQASQADIQKKLQAIQKELADLREQSGKPTGNYAGQDDLKHLAETVQEIDKKREADKQLILDSIKKLGKAVATPASHPEKTTKPSTTNDTGSTASSGGDQSGYNYVIKNGDTISEIAKAYSKQGIKVSSEQILKANPDVNPAKMKVGQTIFIPGPKS